MERSDVTNSQRLAGHVERWHTWPTIRSQTNADHSFHVLRIYSALYGPPESEATDWILRHDMGEVRAGDPPFPSKRNSPVLKQAHDDIETEAVNEMFGGWPEITDEQRRRIKICDLLEMYEFARVELAMGNTFAEPVAEETWKAVTSMSTGSDERKRLIDYITSALGGI